MYGTRRFNPHKLVSQEIVFKPSPTGENIARAVETLNLTGVTINGIVTVNRDDPAPAPTEREMEKQYRDMLAEQFGNRAEAQAALYALFADEPLNNRGAYWCSEAVAEQFDRIMHYLEFSEVA